MALHASTTTPVDKIAAYYLDFEDTHASLYYVDYLTTFVGPECERTDLVALPIHGTTPGDQCDVCNDRTAVVQIGSENNTSYYCEQDLADTVYTSAAGVIVPLAAITFTPYE